MIKEYTFSFSELELAISDFEELMGFENGNSPEPFPELIKKALQEAPDHCNIKGGFKLFDTIELDKSKSTLQIENQLLLPAKIVSIQIKNATGAAIFLCTAGNEITSFAKQAEANGDPLYAYVLDVTGSVIVDKAMDKVQEILYNEMLEKGLGISDRFSPGFCEWSVSDQQKLFRLLPPGFCGVTLSESSLMHPIKTVSGIIGVGKGLKQKGYQCYWCNDPNCIVGKTKRKKKDKKNT